MYVAFYRWRIKTGAEAEFEKLWNEGTMHFRNQQKALGSRLHKADDGSYFAYAQWPNRELYHSDLKLSDAHKEIQRKMRECIAESSPTVLGEVLDDLLL